MFKGFQVYDYLKIIMSKALAELGFDLSRDDFDKLFDTYYGLQFMGRDSLEKACKSKELFEYEVGNCGTWMYEAMHSLYGEKLSAQFNDDKQDKLEDLVSEYILNLES